jgi:hypothetical protein
MNIDNIIGREQTSIHDAEVAVHAGARASHYGLAKTYGQHLVGGLFWDRQSVTKHLQTLRVQNRSKPEDGPDIRPGVKLVDTSIDRDAEKHLEDGEGRLAADFADGRVSPKAFQTRSRFLRQERARMRSPLRDTVSSKSMQNITSNAMLSGVGHA